MTGPNGEGEATEQQMVANTQPLMGIIIIITMISIAQRHWRSSVRVVPTVIAIKFNPYMENSCSKLVSVAAFVLNLIV